MCWEELNDEEAKKKAREDTGLGASQTAEVAYLETWMKFIYVTLEALLNLTPAPAVLPKLLCKMTITFAMQHVFPICLA